MSDAVGKARVDEAVVRICELGCVRVRAIIRDMREGRPVPDLESLTAEERAEVLAELQAIMDVYDRPC